MAGDTGSHLTAFRCPGAACVEGVLCVWGGGAVLATVGSSLVDTF